MSLRQEARPVGWDDLMDDQRRAVVKILRFMQEAHGELGEPTKSVADERVPFRLDRRNSNRMVFLSGSRGTGKTTLYLSLLNQFRAPGSNDTITFKNRAGKELVSQDLQRDYYALLRDTYWLEHVDLEPLPASTNLFAALLARVEGLLDRVMPTCWDHQGACQGTDEGNAANDPRELLRALQNKAALGWDGNSRLRAPRVSPHMFAEETKDAERARLSLPQDFDDLLEAVAKFLKKRNGQTGFEPLFVLPVDDFDLNPGRCIDVARLIRFISSRRLFILAMGDLNTVELTLRIKLAQEIMQQETPRGVQGSPLAEWNEDIRTMASSLAANALRKLFPVNQRIELRPLSVEDALAFNQPTGKATEPTEVKKLENLFGKIKLPKQFTKIESIDDINKFLSTLKDSNQRISYSGSYFLNKPLRHINDYSINLSEISKVEEQGNSDTLFEEFLKFIAKECKYSIHEDENLSLTDRINALDGIVLNTDGKYNFDTRIFKGYQDVCYSMYINNDDNDVTSIVNNNSIIINKLGDKNVILRTSTQDMSKSVTGTKIGFTNQTNSILTLFHDLCSLMNPDRLTSKDLTPGRLELEYFSTAHRMDTVKDEYIKFYWPIPEWVSFWQLDRLFSCIDNKAKEIWDRSISDENYKYNDAWADLVKLWINTISSLELNSFNLDNSFNPLDDFSQYYNLIYKYFFSNKRNMLNKIFAKNWIILSLLLFTPEYGAPTNYQILLPFKEKQFISEKNVNAKKMVDNFLDDFINGNANKIDQHLISLFKNIRAKNIARLKQLSENINSFISEDHSFNRYFNKLVPSLSDIENIAKNLQK